ncbi:MAG: HlyD family efflux transporter periplasmic adaptor subunit, partial [Thermoguttaceae bacterium]|nr:HlyD family efflux transporter periplasmic adaptor subunit [Thermoguttaceae bacterium]
WIYVYVDESDLGKLSPGAEVRILTDSSDKVYTGQIGYISPEAEFTPKNVETEKLRTDLVYRVRIIANDPDNGLRQGMPVTVVIPLDQSGNTCPAGPSPDKPEHHGPSPEKVQEDGTAAEPENI